MKILIKLIRREFKLFFNNKVLLILFCGAPILYGVLIGNVYKKGKVTDLPIVVVDEDRSVLSQKLIQMLDESEVINVAAISGSTFHSKELALKMEAPCVVRIPKGFATDIYLKRYPELTVFVDASNTLTANFASNAINVPSSTMKAGIEIEALKKQGVPANTAPGLYEPFRTTFIKENIRSNNYLYFMLPGVLLTVLQQVLMLGLALSFSFEFENNSFAGLVKQMRNPIGLMFVKIFPYLIMSAGIFALYYGFAFWYRMPLNAPVLPFALATLLFIVSVCMMGILVSVLFPSQLKATEVLMVIATPSFILSGFTWPLSQMPLWVQSLANVIPLTHYLRIFRILFIEHGDPARIHQPMLNLGIILVVCFVLSFVVLYFKIKKINKAG